MPKRIMVVDDEENLLELVKTLLEQEGFEVITASSGKECLEKLKKVKPDLILLDVMMPGMTGREVLEKIRENPKTKGLKVAFLTVVRYSEASKANMERLKVADYITKPFDNKDLIRRVKRLVE